MLCNLRSKFNLGKILPHMIYKKMQPNALLIWQKNIFMIVKNSGVTEGKPEPPPPLEAVWNSLVESSIMARRVDGGPLWVESHLEEGE
jgi:hypothetical protein